MYKKYVKGHCFMVPINKWAKNKQNFLILVFFSRNCSLHAHFILFSKSNFYFLLRNNIIKWLEFKYSRTLHHKLKAWAIMEPQMEKGFGTEFQQFRKSSHYYDWKYTFSIVMQKNTLNRVYKLALLFLHTLLVLVDINSCF